MASVASCFEIAGHQATDALAEEIFAADHLGRLTLSAEWRIVIDREYAKKREKREFMVALRYDCGEAVATHSRFVYYMSKRFGVTKEGIVDMVHHLRECRQAVRRGFCDCLEPHPKLLKLSVGKCALCFLAQASECRECCLLYTSPSPRDATLSRMPSSA